MKNGSRRGRKITTALTVTKKKKKNKTTTPVELVTPKAVFALVFLISSLIIGNNINSAFIAHAQPPPTTCPDGSAPDANGNCPTLAPANVTAPPLSTLTAIQQQQPPASLSNTVKNVAGSVVGIVSRTTEQTTREANPTFDGSGFIFDKQGKLIHIVTADHVISTVPPDEPIDVLFPDGSKYKSKVIGQDPVSDIAVLQIVWNATQPIVPLGLENSSNLQRGQQIILIGNPNLASQTFSNLVTTGIISKAGVDVTTGASNTIVGGIVTNAASAGGNSGGPLLNMEGKVIGMLDAGDDTTQCCSYAIPSNTISHIVPSLIETGGYDHPYSGLNLITLSADLPAREMVPRNVQGVVVDFIARDSPAERAGIKGTVFNQFDEENPIGDVITAVDGHPITTVDEFDAYIESHESVGSVAHFTIYRNGTTVDVPLTFEK